MAAARRPAQTPTPLKRLCLNLRGLMGLGCSSTWRARIWFVEHFHPLCRCGSTDARGPAAACGAGRAPSLCSLCLLPPWVLGEAQGAQTSCPKVSSEGKTGPWAAASSSIAACLAPYWSWLSQVLANGPQHQQVTVAESRGGLSWGMSVRHRAVAKWHRPQLFFTPFPVGSGSEVSVSERIR